MASPTPEERDPQLVAALSQAIQAHSKKHFYAGVYKGLLRAQDLIVRELLDGDRAKFEHVLKLLGEEADEAYKKSLDGRPTG
jgi:hypothetical protein